MIEIAASVFVGVVLGNAAFAAIAWILVRVYALMRKEDQAAIAHLKSRPRGDGRICWPPMPMSTPPPQRPPPKPA